MVSNLHHKGRWCLKGILSQGYTILTNSLSVKEIEFVAKNIHQKKTPGLCGLTGEIYQKFKEEITSTYTNFQQIQEEGNFIGHSMKSVSF